MPERQICFTLTDKHVERHRKRAKTAPQTSRCFGGSEAVLFQISAYRNLECCQAIGAFVDGRGRAASSWQAVTKIACWPRLIAERLTRQGR